jgi:serine phosphatase RsbU (regulator of sigma subunit)
MSASQTSSLLNITDSMRVKGFLVQACYAFDSTDQFQPEVYSRLIFHGKPVVNIPSDIRYFDTPWRMRQTKQDTVIIPVPKSKPKRIWRELVLVNGSKERASLILQLPYIEHLLYRKSLKLPFQHSSYYRNSSSLASFVRDSIIEFELDRGDTLHLISIIPYNNKLKVFKADRLFAEAGRMAFQARNEMLQEFLYSNTIRITLFGVVLTILLYNLVVFLALRARIALFYFLYFLCISWILIDERILETLFRGKVPGGDISLSVFLLGFCAYIAFVLDYLPKTNNTNIYRKLLRFALLFIGIAGIIGLLVEKLTSPDLGFLLMLISLALLLVVILVLAAYILVAAWSWVAWKNGYKPAIFLFVGNAIIIISMAAGFFSLATDFFNSTLERNPWYVFGLILDALIFSFGITSRINLLQKEKEEEQRRSIELLEARVKERTLEISIKNEELEGKNREITDSILYAQRLQNSMLRPLSEMESVIPEMAFLYLPKDIVAGDFYWFHHDEEGWILAICDCTGHGVPGAMVSMVCNDALKTAVLDDGERNPARILDRAAALVFEHFSADDEVTDGMEAGILVYHAHTQSLSWSGANQPLFLISPEGSVEEIKPDKQSIGNQKNLLPFTERQIMPQRGTQLWMSTDGYPDQFQSGGLRKLTRKKFYELLQSLQGKNMKDLEQELRVFHYQYRSEEPQTDDILLAGIKWP